jgi:hypothetical protein
MLEGRKVLLGIQLGSRESYGDWLDFGRGLTARGAPLAGADRRRRAPPVAGKRLGSCGRAPSSSAAPSRRCAM